MEKKENIRMRYKQLPRWKRKLIKCIPKGRKELKSVEGYVINTNLNLIIRRKKTTLHLDAPENTSVLELKKMIEAILKVRPADQQLFLVSENDSSDKYVKLDDSNALSNYKLVSVIEEIHKKIHFVTLGLAFRQEDGSFENLEITPYFEPEPDSDDDASEIRKLFNIKRAERMRAELVKLKASIFTKKKRVNDMILHIN